MPKMSEDRSARQISAGNPMILLGAVTESKPTWVQESYLDVYSSPTETHWTRGLETRVEYNHNYHLARNFKSVRAQEVKVFLENGRFWSLIEKYWCPFSGHLLFYVEHRTLFGKKVDAYDLEHRRWVNLNEYPPGRLDHGLVLLLVFSAVLVLVLLKYDFKNALEGPAAVGAALYALQYIVGFAYSVSLWWRRFRARRKIEHWRRRKDKAVPSDFLRNLADVCSLSAGIARKQFFDLGCR